MKKCIALVLSLGLSLSLMACGSIESQGGTGNEQTTTAEQQESEAGTAETTTAEITEATEADDSSDRTESDALEPDSQEETQGETVAGNKALEENQIRIIVGDNSFIVRLEDNESAAALRELLKDGDKTISASNYGGFEKVCQLGQTLPSNDVQTTTAAGDVMLYSSNQIVIFYDSNSWAYTRLGKVEDLTAEDLEEILSGPETEITLSIQ